MGIAGRDAGDGSGVRPAGRNRGAGVLRLRQGGTRCAQAGLKRLRGAAPAAYCGYTLVAYDFASAAMFQSMNLRLSRPALAVRVLAGVFLLALSLSPWAQDAF